MNSPVIIPPGSVFRRILFNEKGMRAGTRIVIFLPLWWVLRSLLFPILVPFLYVLLHLSVNMKYSQILTITPGRTFVYPFSEFVILLFACWIMAKIERRNMSVYGLTWK